MKAIDVLNREAYISALPLNKEGKELAPKTLAKVMLIKVHYSKAAEKIREELQEVLRGLKKEGYDDRAQKQLRMQDINERVAKAVAWKACGEGDKPEMPTAEEIKEAKVISKATEAFNKETEELTKAYRLANEEKMQEDCDVKDKRMSEECYADVCAVLGTSGEIVFGNEYKEPMHRFLMVIASMFVEE